MGAVEEQNKAVVHKLVEAFNNNRPDCHQHPA